ncbi:hypothetical protein [Haloferula sp. A504]|uniref:hypothetical protein n=1 Tax=Haloferula sp. A504 TaxID=3373601 RepID=UPI0031C807BE|nr:hypothetical protein [Verrucomicrobiaceae bacterium E54]
MKLPQLPMFSPIASLGLIGLTICVLSMPSHAATVLVGFDTFPNATNNQTVNIAGFTGTLTNGVGSRGDGSTDGTYGTFGSGASTTTSPNGSVSIRNGTITLVLTNNSGTTYNLLAYYFDVTDKGSDNTPEDLALSISGGMWISRDGLSTWEQVTQGSQYPKVAGEGYFEDPVIWRTEVQYHLIVNNWHGRIAYHLRSKDGFHWKTDPGEAYTTDFAVSEDGGSEEWYKYERMRVLQDEHRRAIQANFAVIDFNKWEDKPNDIHSSKNISIPLTPGRLLTLDHEDKITDATPEVRVRIAAEPGFGPHQDIDLKSLRFGAPEEVNFGRGAALLRTEKAGKDLVVVFPGKGCGFADHNFAGKLLGKTSKGKLLFGYCRLPWVDYEEPMLTVRRPEAAVREGRIVLRIEVSNHASASEESELKIEADGMPPVSAPCPPLKSDAKTMVEVPLPEAYHPGQSHDLRITTGLDLQQPTVFVARGFELPKR